MGGLAGRVPYVGRPGGARGANGYGDQPGHRDLRMRRIASDEDYAYGAKADVFFEVFGLGEKLKAWGKTKIVRAPCESMWTCKTWTCGSLCQTRKSVVVLELWSSRRVTQQSYENQLVDCRNFGEEDEADLWCNLGSRE